MNTPKQFWVLAMFLNCSSIRGLFWSPFASGGSRERLHWRKAFRAIFRLQVQF